MFVTPNVKIAILFILIIISVLFLWSKPKPIVIVPSPKNANVTSYFACDKTHIFKKGNIFNANLPNLPQNISETQYEFCLKAQSFITNLNLNKNDIFGFPFVSNVFIGDRYISIFRSLADWFFTWNFKTVEVENIKCGDIFFVTSDLVDSFLKKYFKSIKNSFFLITFESDSAIGSPAHLMHLNESKIIRWFAQNVNATHPKLTPIPIGIIPRNKQDFSPMYEAIHNMTSFFNRSNLLYINFATDTNPNRIETLQHFQNAFEKNSRVVFDNSRIPWKDYLLKQKDSQFVLSPPGNGIDCFRTWEALAMGAVPIVLKSDLQPLYDEMPVMVVNDWKDVTEISIAKFQQKLVQRKFSKDGILLRPKLWFRYWINLIFNVRENFIDEKC